MNPNELFTQTHELLPYSPSAGQEEALCGLKKFLEDKDSSAVFLFRGYAGTGKTSLVSGFVKACYLLGVKVELLAPTGRAAKVLYSYTSLPTHTIHRKIYRQNRYTGQGGMFSLDRNRQRDTLFIVDEASMVTHKADTTFGGGTLLGDLIRYVYEDGENCRLIFVGDDAQLPPVGERLGYALSKDALSALGLKVHAVQLNEVVRQESTSGILQNATYVRSLIQKEGAFQLPRLEVYAFEDCKRIGSGNLIEKLESLYSQNSMEETIIITRSNKRALLYNQGIRNQVFFYEEVITSGETLMVTKNNYYALLPYLKEIDMDFLANGELLKVVRVYGGERMYGFDFINLTVQLESTEQEVDIKVILQSLTSEGAGLSKEDQERLFKAVMEDYADEPSLSKRYAKLKENEYFNAVQVKYGYAVTCHKAQGGQWKNVMIDMGGLVLENADETFLSWLYTAITRATHRLYFIDLPKEMRLPKKKTE